MDFNELAQICEDIFDTSNNPFKQSAPETTSGNTRADQTADDSNDDADATDLPNGVSREELDELSKADGSKSQLDNQLRTRIKKTYPNFKDRKRLLDSMVNALNQS